LKRHDFFWQAPILEQNVNVPIAKIVLEKRKKGIDPMPESVLGWGDAPILEQNVNTPLGFCNAAKCCGAAMSGADFSTPDSACQ
jgi:hypothetical protein